MPGRWANSTRAARLPADWHAIRARTWRAAHGQCQATTPTGRCTWTGRLNGDGGQCDHVDREAGEHGPTQWLCPDHHKAKTTLEGSAALPRERRDAEPHPGLA